MSNVTWETIATLREMQEGLMRGDGLQACVYGTQAFANTLTRGLGLLRKEDASWWGVQLKNELMPPGMWKDGERGGTIKVKITMKRAEGKPKGANGKVAFENGLVDGKLPPLEDEAIKRMAWETDCKMIYFKTGGYEFNWEEAEKADPVDAKKRREFIEANCELWEADKFAEEIAARRAQAR